VPQSSLTTPVRTLARHPQRALDAVEQHAVIVHGDDAGAEQRGDQAGARNVRPMALLNIKPAHVYEYIDRREAKTSERREMELLSHALTKAVEWGYLDRHAFKGEVRLEGEKARTRYVEDWEIVECLLLVPRRKSGSVLAAQAYIRLKLLTGIRRGDMLRLTISDLRDDGIYLEAGKTKGSTGSGWSLNGRTSYAWPST
jgi:integrase